MALTKLELIMHPVRLRIMQVLANETMTTQQLGELLPDVPQSTLYRHLKLLLKGGMLGLAETRLVNGIEEKTYQLAQMPRLSAEDMAGLRAGDHLRFFTTYTMTLLAGFSDYLNRAEAAGGIDMMADRVGYSDVAFYASDEEMDELGLAINQAILKLVTNLPGNGRKRRKLAIIGHPLAQKEESDE